MLFSWDEAKHDQHRAARGFGFDFAALIFEGDTLEWIDDREDYGEIRIRAIGEVDKHVLHVVFTDRGDERRLISARLANRKERERWHGTG